MTKLIIFTDFDGTVTKRDGRATVFCDFYKGLLNTPMYNQYNYKWDPLREDIQDRFNAKFEKFNIETTYSKKDSDILMDANAVEFFHEALKQDNVSFNIITKNRADYVIELLKYHGFSMEEISKIEIRCSGHKDIDVAEILAYTPKADRVLILDDSEEDLGKMINGARSQQYNLDQITAIRAAPGKFEWKEYCATFIKQESSKEEEIDEVVNNTTMQDPSQVDNSPKVVKRDAFFATGTPREEKTEQTSILNP